MQNNKNPKLEALSRCDHTLRYSGPGPTGTVYSAVPDWLIAQCEVGPFCTDAIRHAESYKTDNHFFSGR